MRKPKINEKALAALSPEAQAEARKLLLALEDRYRANPLERYYPHPKQDTFHRAHVALRGFFGGNRSGKTTAGILDDIIQAVDFDALPERLQPYRKWGDGPFYGRIIAPDFTSTMEGVIFQKLREWVPPDQLVGGSWSKGYDKQRRKLNFKNGSWFDFLTFEQDIDKFGGAALHRVHYDEEPPRDIRRESLMRLIDYGGEEIFTMTPLHGMSWMFDEIWLPWERGTLTDAFVQTVDMDDNPHLDQATKERVLAGLSREEREARKSGRFVHFGGMIYGEFDKYTHVTPFDLPKPGVERARNPFRVYVGIDPGLRHMAAVVWVAHFPDDTMIAFEELALTDVTIAGVCKAIHLVNQGLEIQPFAYYIDPAARNRNNQTGRSDQMEFIQHGIITVPGQNSVTAGINAVKERLQSDRLLIASSCPTLIDEFPKYRWKPAGRGQAEPKEEPVKADDHLLDALRYVCMSMPTAPTDFVAPLNESPIEKLLREDQEGVNFRKQRKNQSTEMGDIFQ